MKNLNPIFIITILLMAFSLICPQRTQAGEVYTYTDKDGRTVVTNMQIPDEYKAKAQKIGSYKELTPSERSEFEKEASYKYKKILRNAEGKKYSVGGKANTLCLAEIVRIAETSGKPIQPEFWRIVDSAMDGKYSVGGRYNKICEAALIQGINVSGIATCQTAVYHSKGRGRKAGIDGEMIRQRKNSYTAQDAFGTPVNSKNFHLTRDAFDNIVGSSSPHLTRDAFGNIVGSSSPHLTRDAFGTIIMNK